MPTIEINLRQSELNSITWLLRRRYGKRLSPKSLIRRAVLEICKNEANSLLELGYAKPKVLEQ